MSPLSYRHFLYHLFCIIILYYEYKNTLFKHRKKRIFCQILIFSKNQRTARFRKLPVFECFYIIFGLFCRPRMSYIRLRKSFQKRPIGNITVCNRKSPVFGIYIIARLYAIFFCVFPAPFFRISSEFFANPDIDGNTTVFTKTSPYNAE